jgi:predicted SAM-dependent methyltransferase
LPVSDAENITDRSDDSFVIAISCGNIFENIKKGELVNFLQRYFKILKRNGVLLIQVLNFEKIVREKQKIININNGGY